MPDKMWEKEAAFNRAMESLPQERSRNLIPCRMRIAKRWHSANRRRRMKGLPLLPRPEMPPKGAIQCDCAIHRKNRRNVKLSYLRARGLA